MRTRPKAADAYASRKYQIAQLLTSEGRDTYLAAKTKIVFQILRQTRDRRASDLGGTREASVWLTEA